MTKVQTYLREERREEREQVPGTYSGWVRGDCSEPSGDPARVLST